MYLCIIIIQKEDKTWTNMFILGFPLPVYTPCAYRELSYWQRSGVNTSGGRSVFVLDGLARISRRVHPLFVLCSPGGLHPATFQTDSGLGCTRNVLRRTFRVLKPVWKGYQTSRKFPLQFMSIYSNENIRKIMKLSPCEFPHLHSPKLQKLWRICRLYCILVYHSLMIVMI